MHGVTAAQLHILLVLEGEGLPPGFNRLAAFSPHPLLRGHPATPRSLQRLSQR